MTQDRSGLEARSQSAHPTTMSPASREQLRMVHRLAGRPSLTAEAVTLARAAERLRPVDERIVDDPYARLFLGRRARGTLAAWSRNGPATRLLTRLGPGRRDLHRLPSPLHRRSAAQRPR